MNIKDDEYNLHAFIKIIKEMSLKDAENLNNDLVIPEWKLDDEYLMISSHALKTKYEKTLNPVYAISAFLLYIERGFYPPLWVLDWLKNGFNVFIGEAGESLDKILGFKHAGGAKTKWKNAMICELEEVLSFEIFSLHRVFFLSVEDAAELVSRWYPKSITWEVSGSGMPEWDADTLRQYYSREWSSKYKTFSDENLRIWFPTDERKHGFIQKYLPYDVGKIIPLEYR